jgi:hypothetical protein
MSADRTVIFFTTLSIKASAIITALSQQLGRLESTFRICLATILQTPVTTSVTAPVSEEEVQP